MYRANKIIKRSIDQYILFSRVSSLRGMLQTLSGLEYAPKDITTKRPPQRRRSCFGMLLTLDAGNDHVEEDERFEVNESDKNSNNDASTTTAPHRSEESSSVADAEQFQKTVNRKKRGGTGIPVGNGVPHPPVKLSRAFVPFIIRFTVLVLQLAAIFFSSNVSDEIQARRSFNVRLTDNNTVLNTSQVEQSECREFIEGARGVEQNGSVLLCIGSEETIEFNRFENTVLHFRFDTRRNSIEYVVEDAGGFAITVYLRTRINLIGDDDVQLGLLRPDLEVDRNYSKRLIQRVMKRAVNQLGFDVNRDQIEERIPEASVIEYSFNRNFGRTRRASMADALLSELRQLSFDLNVTQVGEEDVLYAFKTNRGYFRHENPVIAVVSKNRVAQGWLIIIWIVVLIVRLTAQHFFMSFDELAYVELKKIHGVDASVGPLAKVERIETLKVKKFSDGRVGRIGFRAANEREMEVENFYGCEAVM
ncbi:hypothetical protein FGB62_271g014 [Gracilaria domingensis]|nr:hypothetical protein FGB62_271g014 [Gracilaria domingensis]